MYKVNVSNKISEHQILKIYAGFKHKSENIWQEHNADFQKNVRY